MHRRTDRGFGVRLPGGDQGLGAALIEIGIARRHNAMVPGRRRAFQVR
jgi:hypothetical protein